jgi:ABC-type sugar transport system ATPase subunit
MADVHLDRVSMGYRRGEMVLREFSLHVRDGELLAVVGPSGSGKSTVLRLISGLESPGSGEVRIGGRRADHLPPHERGIAMVPQGQALYPHMTVERNLRFGLAGARSDAGQRTREAAGALGIAHLLGRFPGELSGGERQRAALAKAMARRPRVFLFDEPLSSLDVQLREAARREIKALHQQLGTTMIHVTHDQEEAMMLGDRIAVLHQGVLLQVGRPLEVYRQPANAFVAAFIGLPAMNLLPGRIVRSGRRAEFVETGGKPLRLEIGGPIPGMPTDAQELEAVVGIRPQAFRPAGSDAGAAIVLAITLVEPSGAWTDVTGMLPSGRRIVARLMQRQELHAGQELALTVDPSELHLFEPGPLGRNLLIDSAGAS